MTDLPEPLVPEDCDLRDFPFMPLEVARFRDSDLASLPDAEARWANVMAWAASWHQLPAGSLPNDDAALCRLLGYGRKLALWRKIRAAGGLHGWIECRDGRLYHPAVAARVDAAWSARLSILRRVDFRLSMLSGEWAAIRASVFARDNYSCAYCGERGGKLECDHIVPVSAGGTNDLNNLATACFSCNRSKGARMLSDWRPS